MSLPSSRIRPDVGCTSRTSILAIVDFPQPDSPTSPEGLPALHREGDAVDGTTVPARGL